MWKQSEGMSRPLDSPLAGYEKTTALFIARAPYQNGIHPCKFVDNRGCYVSYGGKEYQVDKFEYYVGNVKWVKCKNHEIPLGAILAGQEADGKMLYVGRAEYDGCLILGKVGKHLPQGICIPYYGKEIDLPEYEILVEG